MRIPWLLSHRVPVMHQRLLCQTHQKTNKKKTSTLFKRQETKSYFVRRVPMRKRSNTRKKFMTHCVFVWHDWVWSVFKHHATLKGDNNVFFVAVIVSMATTSRHFPTLNGFRGKRCRNTSPSLVELIIAKCLAELFWKHLLNVHHKWYGEKAETLLCASECKYRPQHVLIHLFTAVKMARRQR